MVNYIEVVNLIWYYNNIHLASVKYLTLFWLANGLLSNILFYQLIMVYNLMDVQTLVAGFLSANTNDFRPGWSSFGVRFIVSYTLC